MKFQNFIMRVLCLILIIAAVLGYNSMQKDSSEDEKDQQIASLTKRVDALEEQQEEMLTAINEVAKAREEAEKAAQSRKKEDAEKKTEEAADSEEASEAEEQSEEEETEELAYKNGTYTGEGQGFGGTITVAVTLQDDEITDIQVASAPGEDSAYLSQGKGVISSILSEQSTDVDTVSGATFSSTGIINAVNDALGKAENL